MQRKFFSIRWGNKFENKYILCFYVSFFCFALKCPLSWPWRLFLQNGAKCFYLHLHPQAPNLWRSWKCPSTRLNELLSQFTNKESLKKFANSLYRESSTKMFLGNIKRIECFQQRPSKKMFLLCFYRVYLSCRKFLFSISITLLQVVKILFENSRKFLKQCPL